MNRSKQLLVAWLPVVLWLLLIFGASTDVMSSTHTSRIIGPVLRWINPEISDATVRGIQIGVRKCGHLTEYAILALLLYRATRRTLERPADIWCRRCAATAWAIAFLYAASDEWHQTFVPSRGPSIHDVMIDSAGALLGLLLWRWWLLSQRERKLQPAD